MSGETEKYDATVTISHNDREFTIMADEIIECEHCGYEWTTRSEMKRPSCPECSGHTDRDVKGKHFEVYLKYALFDGEEGGVEDVTERLQHYQDLFEALEANGWHFDCTTRSSHVAFSKGDVEPQNITA